MQQTTYSERKHAGIAPGEKIYITDDVNIDNRHQPFLCAGGVAEDEDCIVVTSQCYGTPNGSFKEALSEFELCLVL